MLISSLFYSLLASIGVLLGSDTSMVEAAIQARQLQAEARRANAELSMIQHSNPLPESGGENRLEKINAEQLPESITPITADDALPLSITVDETDDNMPLLIEMADGPVDDARDYEFIDHPPSNDKKYLHYPDWFKKSQLNLHHDLKVAAKQNKNLLLYFAAPNCAYCEQLQDVILEQPDIKTYIRHYFDVVGINAMGGIVLTTPEGILTTESEYAASEETYFTPSLLFYVYDKTLKKAHSVLRLRGYYPAYVIRAALDYVQGKEYLKESFNEYIAAVKPPPPKDYTLHKNPLFMLPPYQLERRKTPGKRPLLVIFEQGQCHACDRFHQQHMTNPDILEKLKQMEVVQFNLQGDTPLTTPQGRKLTASAWAKKLGLFYTPSLLFFDEWGREILRIESIVGLHRLNVALDFVLEQGYRNYGPNLMRWYMHKLRNQSKQQRTLMNKK
ncbi:thioredoxin fold domain-containing protein [Candidatus Venteria ishoeyi]|uniref:thioredoxin family protein n=1 Tax=Candidatus Venteria ishoeyi TaxID=1899563 RepID=UPI0025A6469E|nr:thioredoxin fold domain-containing protein [Candidatus Venteria ishoeyi]MDM8545041.1 thioredoxin fold domain-containing protein [Candidatus Venteria ishoeyi]